MHATTGWAVEAPKGFEMPNDLAAVTDTTLTNVSKKVIKRAATASSHAGYGKFASELLSDASTRSSEKVERLAILGPCTALCKTSPRSPARFSIWGSICGC